MLMHNQNVLIQLGHCGILIDSLKQKNTTLIQELYILKILFFHLSFELNLCINPTVLKFPTKTVYTLKKTEE